MSKRYNESVVYVRNGIDYPAIVLKSATYSHTEDAASKQVTVVEPYESLTLLHAGDTEAGESLINAGQSSKTPQIAFSVKPWTEGSTFGWKNWGDTAPVQPLDESETIDPDGKTESERGFPYHEGMKLDPQDDERALATLVPTEPVADTDGSVEAVPEPAVK